MAAFLLQLLGIKNVKLQSTRKSVSGTRSASAKSAKNRRTISNIDCANLYEPILTQRSKNNQRRPQFPGTDYLSKRSNNEPSQPQLQEVKRSPTHSMQAYADDKPPTVQKNSIQSAKDKTTHRDQQQTDLNRNSSLNDSEVIISSGA